MKRKIVVFAGLLSVVVLGAFFFFKGREYHLVVSEAQLQAKLDEVFPLEKDYLFIFRVRLTEPDLRLEDGSDRIDYGMRVALTIADLEALDGHARLSGSLRYEPSQGAFYLDRSTVTSLSVEGIPDEYKGKAEDAIKAAAEHYLDWFAVYRLKDDDLQQMAARLVLKRVEVIGKELHITLGL